MPHMRQFNCFDLLFLFLFIILCTFCKTDLEKNVANRCSNSSNSLYKFIRKHTLYVTKLDHVLVKDCTFTCAIANKKGTQDTREQ